MRYLNASRTNNSFLKMLVSLSSRWHKIRFSWATYELESCAGIEFYIELMIFFFRNQKHFFHLIIDTHNEQFIRYSKIAKNSNLMIYCIYDLLALCKIAHNCDSEYRRGICLYSKFTSPSIVRILSLWIICATYIITWHNRNSTHSSKSNRTSNENNTHNTYEMEILNGIMWSIMLSND